MITCMTETWKSHDTVEWVDGIKWVNRNNLRANLDVTKQLKDSSMK